MCLFFLISRQLWHNQDYPLTSPSLSTNNLRTYATISSIENQNLRSLEISGLRTVTDGRVSPGEQPRPALPDRVNVKAEIMGWHHLVKVGQFYPLRVCPSLGQKPLHNGGKCPTVS